MSVLHQIFERKHEEVKEARGEISQRDLISIVKGLPPTLPFLEALKAAPRDIALIAEIKRASPSQGVIRENFDPAEIARAYERSGASALSVLTDRHFFGGSPQNIAIAKEAATLPCLRKDFIDDPYQIYEARAWGADAVLLIVAALEGAQLTELMGLATEMGMDSLVEVHNEAEANLALAARCELIGVNNRDLKDLSTDISVTERLGPMVAPRAFMVSESALETRADIDRARNAGAKAVLIGTSFCAAPDVEAKVREVTGW